MSALTWKAEDLLFAVLDGPNRIPAEIPEEIRQWRKQCLLWGWWRWLQSAVVINGPRYRIENYPQVAATALMELRGYARPRDLALDQAAVTDNRRKDTLEPAVQGNAESAQSEVIGLLGGVDLADALGVHPSRREAFIKQLERRRINLGDECWQEIANPRPNSPQFLYHAGSPVIRDLAASYRTPKPA